MDLDERKIRELHSTWISAVNAGDLVGLLTLMADDVVFLNPGQAPFGRDGFSVNFSAAHQQVRIRCSSELDEVVVVGEVAYTRSRDALSVTPRSGGTHAEIMQILHDGEARKYDAYVLATFEKIIASSVHNADIH